MNKEKVYKGTLFACIILSAALITKNYFLVEEKMKCNTKLSNLEQISENKKLASKSTKYSDIIKFLKVEEGINVIKLNEEKDNKTEVQVENNWDVIKTADMLKDVENKKKLAHTNKLSIEKDKENKISTKINMEVEK
jgi:hypothetical protein